MTGPITRRDALIAGLGGLAAGALADGTASAVEAPRAGPARPYLTPGEDFTDVSRGDPVPHTLEGEALAAARLTPEDWRLEVVAEEGATLGRPRRIEDGSAIDFKELTTLGDSKGVRFLKAMQCNNIALPLGQGLWEGVPLRDVLGLCGTADNARRLYYWGFHNNDPKQMFRSSLAMNQALDSAPGDLPPFVAYRLNGGPIPLERGGPVRMVVPWAHGFKSVKWLQKIVLTNAYQANDTYALRNNDPESQLKTAAYFDSADPESFPAEGPVLILGTAMVGWPGLERVECWLRPDAGTDGKIDDDDPSWASAKWRPAAIAPPPADWSAETADGAPPKDLWGFDPQGRPKDWPPRFSVARWSISLDGLKPGRYELRARTVDRNGFAQPLPRPGQRSGRNLVACKLLTVG